HEKTQVKHKPGKNQTIIKKQKNRTVVKNTPHGQNKITVQKKTVIKDKGNARTYKPKKEKKQVTAKENRKNKARPVKEKPNKKANKHKKQHKEARLDRRTF
ncbi:MAG: hypothetical protein R3312_08700, partial [Gammaproteobacteria bacterium]|nr:hypothetical protein [Gammaproteobacteria bacterium]